MKRFDLFGSRLQVSTVADLIRGALGVELELHESGYRGGDYYRSVGPDGAEIIVQTNCEDDEGYFAETGFAEYQSLIYVNGGTEEIGRAISTTRDLELLRSEEI